MPPSPLHNAPWETFHTNKLRSINTLQCTFRGLRNRSRRASLPQIQVVEIICPLCPFECPRLGRMEIGSLRAGGLLVPRQPNFGYL